MTRPPRSIPGVILAGGLATRLGGGDKTLLPLGDGTILGHVIARLRPQVGRIALNANGDPARFAAYPLPVIADSVAGFPGPLGGILAAMDWAAGHGAQSVVTVAGDTPFFPPDLVARLAAGLGRPACPVIAATADGWHPTFGLWPVDLRDDLRAALAGGARRVRLWARDHGARQAMFDGGPHDPFFNINTADDLALARKMCGPGG
ncbi:molybdenum cofactor guanylyltransferase MobA [Aquicoccus porphyridii]|uniref:molybdenum cofactor guanylyltransferase MobA n=1 Tax=Aquicoccus porphyridii TaxID=1852029 RepID=UPI002740280A|nr:molybdenum cofactor guanylyltransferase MobA [Aquicoccus porphyridii]